MWDWAEIQAAGWADAVLAILGAIAGSFASVAISRFPEEELSVWKPKRSFCPVCKQTLAWYDNVPILSYFWLLGRCRQCKTSIHWTYCLNELVLGAAFVVAGRSSYGDDPLALFLLLPILTAFWIAAVIDWHWFILPDEVTLGGIPYGIVAACLVPAFHGLEPGSDFLPWGLGWFGLGADQAPWLLAGASAVLSATLGAGLLFGIGKLFSYLLRQDALGFGDVKYLATVGALVGLEGAAFTFLIGVFTGALLGLLNVLRMIGVVSWLRARRGRKRGWGRSVYLGWKAGRVIPFGPHLILGTVFVLLARQTVRDLFHQWPNWVRDWLL